MFKIYKTSRQNKYLFKKERVSLRGFESLELEAEIENLAFKKANNDSEQGEVIVENFVQFEISPATKNNDSLKF